MGFGEAGEQSGPYRVVRQIGSGGMGSIFEAIDARLGHRVALKRLHPHVAARPGATERFLREGRAVARIRHPHVVQVFALDEGSAGPYLAMELLEGADLATTLARTRTLNVADALALLLPAIAGVAAAHEAGVIHRDLKPSNIFIAQGPAGRCWPKVLDFGVSKVLDPSGAVESSATDAIVGTAAYMAPEQTRSARETSFRSDQYALAVILYQCLTGSVPFSGASDYEVTLAVMTAPVFPPSAHVPNLPPGLDDVILQAMNRNPDDRFASVRALGAALLPFARERDRHAWSAELGADLAHGAISAAAPDADSGESVTPATMPPTARDTRVLARGGRGPVRARVAALALATVLVGAATWLVRPDRRPPRETIPQSLRAMDDESRKKAPATVEMTAPVVSEPSVTDPLKPAAPEVAKARPHASGQAARTSLSASPSSAIRPGLPTPTLGENGAPILP